MELKRILVPTDFSTYARAALEQALDLALRYDAEICLLHVSTLHGDDPNHPDAQFPEIQAMLERMEERAAESMAELKKELGERGAGLRTCCVRAVSAAPAITEFVRREEMDLVVMGTHGRRGLRRCLMGSVAEEVLRTVQVPVLTTRLVERDAGWRRILVPYDFSDGADQALATAVDLARRHGAEIDLVHVVMPPVMPAGITGAGVVGSVGADLKKDLQELLHARASDAALRSGVFVQPYVLEGAVDFSITELARLKATDLIVMGSHGLSGFWRFLLGSVTEKVVRSAPCPVWVRRLEAAAPTTETPSIETPIAETAGGENGIKESLAAFHALSA